MAINRKITINLCIFDLLKDTIENNGNINEHQNGENNGYFERP